MKGVSKHARITNHTKYKKPFTIFFKPSQHDFRKRYRLVCFSFFLLFFSSWNSISSFILAWYSAKVIFVRSFSLSIGYLLSRKNKILGNLYPHEMLSYKLIGFLYLLEGQSNPNSTVIGVSYRCPVVLKAQRL